MSTPTLNYPVYTLDGRQLLPAGTLLDETTMQRVAVTDTSTTGCSSMAVSGTTCRST